MYSEFLPAFIGNAAVNLALELPGVVGGGVSLPDILRFCARYRRKGIASLFVSGVPDGLHRELSNSGHAFAHYLSLEGDAGKATSKAAPLFDAVAANDLACAREIAQRSRPTWNPELEYEEDFLYIRWLMMRFLLAAAAEECGELLAMYEAVVGDASEPRLDVCRALHEGDAPAFGAAVCALLETQENRYRGWVAANVVVPEVVATEARLNVEGLALVRLAELGGLATEANYLTVPSLARENLPETFDPAAWQRPM